MITLKWNAYIPRFFFTIELSSVAEHYFIKRTSWRNKCDFGRFSSKGFSIVFYLIKTFKKIVKPDQLATDPVKMLM